MSTPAGVKAIPVTRHTTPTNAVASGADDERGRRRAGSCTGTGIGTGTGKGHPWVERRLRLRRQTDVRRARSRGRAAADGPLVARVLVNGSLPPANRYTVIAGKKSGNSVHRNRLKRLVREALRALHPTLRPGHDVVLLLRGTVADLPDYATALATLDRVVRRANLLQRQPPPPPAAAPHPRKDPKNR